MNNGNYAVSSTELTKLLESNEPSLVFDLRTKEMYETGHIRAQFMQFVM